MAHFAGGDLNSDLIDKQNIVGTLDYQMENLRYIDRLGWGLPLVYCEVTNLEQTAEFKEVGDEFWAVLSIRK